MPVQITEAPSTPKATYKALEVEGALDRLFYRKVGFLLAKFFAWLNITPSGVSLLGGVCGVIAGHLYYYRDLTTNMFGIALHVCANALDNADGQLARLLGTSSREGRVIDSLADHIVFASVYIHLAFRYFNQGTSPTVFLLALVAGISHALQGAATDYYRTSYLHFVTGKSVAALDCSQSLRSAYDRLRWTEQPWNKFLLALYFNFMRQQEMLSPRLKTLRKTFNRFFPDGLPDGLKLRYQISAQPMLKLWGLLMTNTRMLVLFVLLFTAQPVWYFWFEITLLNLLLACLIYRQENMARSLIALATAR